MNTNKIKANEIKAIELVSPITLEQLIMLAGEYREFQLIMDSTKSVHYLEINKLNKTINLL